MALVRREEFPRIGTAMETRRGNYIAGVMYAGWARSIFDGDVIVGWIYIDEVKESRVDEKVEYNKERIFGSHLPVRLSTDNSRIKKELDRFGSDGKIEDWGEFFMLFEPILEYYRRVASIHLSTETG